MTLGELYQILDIELLDSDRNRFPEALRKLAINRAQLWLAIRLGVLCEPWLGKLQEYELDKSNWPTGTGEMISVPSDLILPSQVKLELQYKSGDDWVVAHRLPITGRDANLRRLVEPDSNNPVFFYYNTATQRYFRFYPSLDKDDFATARTGIRLWYIKKPTEVTEETNTLNLGDEFKWPLIELAVIEIFKATGEDYKDRLIRFNEHLRGLLASLSIDFETAEISMKPYAQTKEF